jgi:hypothetical protein
LALFATDRALNPTAVEQEKRSRIEVTNDDLRQQDVTWMVQLKTKTFPLPR